MQRREVRKEELQVRVPRQQPVAMVGEVEHLLEHRQQPGDVLGVDDVDDRGDERLGLLGRCRHRVMLGSSPRMASRRRTERIGSDHPTSGDAELVNLVDCERHARRGGKNRGIDGWHESTVTGRCTVCGDRDIHGMNSTLRQRPAPIDRQMCVESKDVGAAAPTSLRTSHIHQTRIHHFPSSPVRGLVARTRSVAHPHAAAEYPGALRR